MQYYNLKVLVSLKQDIKSEETYEQISKLISNAMLKDEKLKEMHEENMYKNYVFCNLYPIEKDGIYKKEHIYTFDIRFINLQNAMKIKQLLTITREFIFQSNHVKFRNKHSKKNTKINNFNPHNYYYWKRRLSNRRRFKFYKTKNDSKYTKKIQSNI